MSAEHCSRGLRRLPRARLAVVLLLPLLTALPLYLPDAALEAFRGGLGGVVIGDRRGRVLACLPGEGGSYQQRLSWTELPERGREVFVRLEDRRFYRHRGVDFLAGARALLSNLEARRVVSGASTITMQLARLLAPHGEGLWGKAAEALRALRLETRLDKREILLLWLNNLPFGYNTRGLGAAARLYFDRSVAELSRGELLLLATIPKAPSLYDPLASSEQREQTLRQAQRLAPLAGVPPAELAAALERCRRGAPVLQAPHFVAHVRGQLEAEASRRLLPAGAGGIVRVVTTLDLELYGQLAGRLREELAARRGGPAAGPAQNAAALVLENGSGEVLAWVGSQDYFGAAPGGQIDGVLARSSSGSTLKPFLYALALERGFTAASLLPDVGLSFGAGESYRPENFDRRRRSLVRLRTALGGSLNAPAVYLLSRVGLREFLALCGELGFALPREAASRYGLGAAVGNAEVSLLELTRAFACLPGRGVLPPLRCVRQLVPAFGPPLAPPPGWGGEETPRRVLREQTAWLISDILSDPAARSTGFGVTSRFDTPFPAVFKSGTASEYSSLWCLGAAAGCTVGVWAGNFDGRAAFGTTGSSLPGQVVVETLEQLRGRPPDGTPGAAAPPEGPPAGLERRRICSSSGLLAGPECPATREEYFVVGTAPRRSCPLHLAAGTEGAGGPAGAAAAEELLLETVLEGSEAPRILFPLQGSLFYADPAVSLQSQGIPLWVAVPAGGAVRVTLNGRLLGEGSPRGVELPVQPGSYRLVVSAEGGQDAVSYAVR